MHLGGCPLGEPADQQSPSLVRSHEQSGQGPQGDSTGNPFGQLGLMLDGKAIRLSESRASAIKSGTTAPICNVRGMDSTVEAAWIAASVGVLSLAATIATSLIGYRNARNVAIEASRSERIGGRMADAYEGILTALIRRQSERKDAAILYRNPGAEERMRRTSQQDDPEWFEAQGRVIAYSSPEVRRGLKIVRLADEDTAMNFSLWQMIKKEAAAARESGIGLHQERSSGELREIMNQALEISEKIENSLIDLIRAELKGEDTTKLAERLDKLARHQPWAFMTDE
jgi:hypothetical protein